jgi:K+-transporting ATPase ATPase A chain
MLAGTDQVASATQPGGNMEGKEVRFGIANSALFATVTTDASCGAINSQHDSFTPLGGMVPLINIMLGEIGFGGVGSALYRMMVFVILAVFIASPSDLPGAVVDCVRNSGRFHRGTHGGANAGVPGEENRIV